MHHENLLVQSDRTKSDHAFQATHFAIKARCCPDAAPLMLLFVGTKNQTLICDPPLYFSEN